MDSAFLHSRRPSAFLVFLLLLVVSAAIFRPILGIQPLHGDNLYALAWVDQAPITALLQLDPGIYPEWRPLPYTMLWLEHRIVQLDAVALHHVINLLLWVTCAWLIYLLAVTLAAPQTVAVFSALFLLVDQRSVTAMTWIIERQTTLACCFGLAALIVVVRAGMRELRFAEACLIGVLLLAAALSKEYGLAFSGALAVHALAYHRRALGACVGSGVLAYAALRLGAAGGAFGGYCEDMGLGFSVEERCIGAFSQTELLQMTYNAVATGIGTLVPALFNDEGMVDVRRWDVAARIAVLLPFAAAVAARLPLARTLASILLFNAVLSVMVYRTRNQLIGAAAIAVVIALGFSLARRYVSHTSVTRTASFVAIVFATAYLSREAVITYHRVQQESASLLGAPPCNAPLTERPFVERFVTRVHQRYNTPMLECLASD